jgi:DNA helicase-2/ATP-dependent DNA helicase PcrA
MQLTPEQQQIVNHQQGHARVSAVAGSGKTTAMVARVHHLLSQGIHPDKILVLMFNKSAREAFADKLHQALAQEGLTQPAVRTFHSLGLRLIKSFTGRGFLPSFTLLTHDYQLEKLAREAMKSFASTHGGDESWFEKDNMENFLLFIDLVKSDVRPIRELFDIFQLPEELSYYVEAFATFESMRINARVRFYSDLIYEPVQAMLNDNDLTAWVENHVDYIIVDEYQDINEVQQQLLRCIAGIRAQVMVVGDVDQCIYEWRGAKPDYIVSRFNKDFIGVKTYTLSYTFRYGHRLSLTANHLINNNRFRDRKLCLSHASTPDTRLHWRQETDPHPIAKIINQWQQNNRSLNQTAVLVRIYAMSIPVELALLENNIPYQLLGHETVFSCPEIQALLGYLYLCQGGLQSIRDRDEALEIVIAMLTNPHLWLKQEDIHTLAAEILNSPARAADLIRQQSSRANSSYLGSRMLELATVWEKLTLLSSSTKAVTVLEKAIHDTHLFDFYDRFSSRLATAVNRIKTCQALVGFARRRNQDVTTFLADIEQLQQTDENAPNDRLLITSIHRAKGLEWPLVILPGLEDGTIPRRQEDDPEGGEGIEDERRLMYVGMTRAIEQLYLLYPEDRRLEQRNRNGDSRCPASTEDGKHPASCFLYEANLRLSDEAGARILQTEIEGNPLQAKDLSIVRQYLKAIKTDVPIQGNKPQSTPRKKKKEKQPKPKWLGERELTKGLKVTHKTFGIGTVKSTSRHQGVVTVHFPSYGLQNMVINLAKLRKIEADSE